jgi:hypothetical protein
LSVALCFYVVIEHTWLSSPEHTPPFILPPAPTQEFLKLAGLGEAPVAARISMLWLQSLDRDKLNQSGSSLDSPSHPYSRLIDWLNVIMRADPAGQAPMLAATHIYTLQENPAGQRQLLKFVESEFVLAPVRHWRWMADATIIAQHLLGDLPLALHFAEQLRLHANQDEVPTWARQMSVFLLEKMGQREAASIILGGLIESNVVKDPHEKRFLLEKLDALKTSAAPAQN